MVSDFIHLRSSFHRYVIVTPSFEVNTYLISICRYGRCVWGPPCHVCEVFMLCFVDSPEWSGSQLTPQLWHPKQRWLLPAHTSLWCPWHSHQTPIGHSLRPAHETGEWVVVWRKKKRSSWQKSLHFCWNILKILSFIFFVIYCSSACRLESFTSLDCLFSHELIYWFGRRSVQF